MIWHEKLFFAELCQKAKIPKGVINIITGDGSTGQHLVNHQLINKIAFTGSTEVGKKIISTTANSNKKLTLCGVKIPHPPLIGHSDADVGYHAICDSILGSLSMRDIGYYFNNNNLKWKNANSNIFMKFCNQLLKRKKFIVVNLDINFICEKPNIKKYIKQMKINISTLLNMNKKRISIKATTNEKIGFIGKREGIAAESIVQIQDE